MIAEKELFIRKNQLANEHLHFVGCDVNEHRIADALRNHPKFDPKLRTLFVAEGFFDYLSLLPSENLLEDIRTLNRKNTLVSTFFSLDELSLFHNMVFRTGVRLVGESLQFKITRDEFVELLDDLGFELNYEVAHSTMKQEFVKQTGMKLPVLKGFYVLSFRQYA